MANSMNVTTGKPKVGGAIYRAPLGTPLPTTATENLHSAFRDLGFASEDGLTSSNSRESEEIKAWGGTTVLTSQTDYKDTWKLVFIESMNIDVLKMVFGDANVTETPDGIIVKANAAELDQASYVIDMIMKGGVLKRVVLPVASISEVGDVKYVDNEAVGYDVTLSAMPDTAENTHYEYIYKPASAQTVTTYNVTQNLTNVTSTFTGTTVEEGVAFQATIEAEATYTLGAVEVTMGGVDITGTAYDNGQITIASVTGDIVITAIAS